MENNCKKIKNSDWQKWLEAILREIQNQQFFGKVQLHFESGRLVHLKREENLKPPRECQ